MLFRSFSIFSIFATTTASFSTNIFIDTLLSNPFETRPIDEFFDFIAKYEKVYITVEEISSALEKFSENWNSIHHHDSNYEGYELEINEFADMTSDEFRQEKINGHGDKGCFLPKKTTGLYHTTTSCQRFESEFTELPHTIDWRDYGAVTDVKNQGQCGSCWSFSATGAMEGAWYIKTGDLVSLSEQQLIGCSTSYGNDGCNGGLMDSAFEYAMDSGMCTENEAPYTARDDSCSLCKHIITIDSCTDVTSNNQKHLKEAVSRGPVSIGIEADTRVFQFYSGGVMGSPKCGTSLDHGVLIIGYGEEEGKKYWLVKNSWGDGWGEDGYIKILRSEEENDPGICGIAIQPSQPVC